MVKAQNERMQRLAQKFEAAAYATSCAVDFARGAWRDLPYDGSPISGWPMAGRKPTQAAVREVYEEAGLIGVVSRGSEVGRYRYRKRLPTGKFVTCEVTVFLLRVRKDSSSGRNATSA